MKYIFICYSLFVYQVGICQSLTIDNLRSYTQKSVLDINLELIKNNWTFIENKIYPDTKKFTTSKWLHNYDYRNDSSYSYDERLDIIIQQGYPNVVYYEFLKKETFEKFVKEIKSIALFIRDEIKERYIKSIFKDSEFVYVLTFFPNSYNLDVYNKEDAPYK